MPGKPPPHKGRKRIYRTTNFKEMNTPPAFQFYAQDFLTGVMYLTNEEKGIYITMLAKQWTDGKIPKKRLGFLVGYDWDKLSEELKEKFTDLGDYLVNERLEKEREKKEKFIEKQSENGKKGGRPKKKKTSESTEKPKEKTQTKPKPFKNKNPKENQKKPLEDRRLKTEKEDEKEKRKGGVGKNEKSDLKIPWETENFRVQWRHWKIYKKKEFGFKFKSLQSEQAALTELANKSGGEEKKAVAIMHQSMSQGWKGLFELKNNGNEKINGKAKYSSEYENDLKRRLGIV